MPRQTQCPAERAVMVSGLHVRRSWRRALLAAVAFASLSGGQASASGDASGMAREWMRTRGIALGADRAAGRWATAVSRKVPVAVDAADYAQARIAAFDGLVMEGKREFAEYLGARVNGFVQGSSTMEEICGDGGAMSTLAGGSSWRKSEEFARVAEVAANATVSLLLPCQSFEAVDSGHATVALVLVADRRMAAGSPAGLPAGEPADRWFAGIDDQVLARTWGVRPIVGTDGRFRLVSFGQAVVLDESLEADACGLSRETALEGLRTAVMDQMATTAFRSLGQALENSSELPREWASVQEFRQSVERAYAGSVTGESVIGRRIVVDPASGRRICVTACTTEGSTSAASSPVDARSGCPPVPASMSGRMRAVQGSGSGTTREAALKVALLDAVAQDGVRVVGSSTLRRRYEEALVRERQALDQMVSSSTSSGSDVTTSSSGFIHSYAVTAEEGSPPAVTVRVCANVVRFDPKDPRFGLPPTVAVLPIAVGSARVGGQAVPAAPFGELAAGILDSALLDSGRFQVLDERSLPELSKVREDISRRQEAGSVDDMELVKLGHALTADFVVIGRLGAVEFLGPPGQRPSGIAASHSASATLDVRMVNVADGTVACHGTYPVVLTARQVLLARAGKELQSPDEQSLAPAELAVARSARAAAAALMACGPGPAPAAGQAGVPGIVRVGSLEVSLDASRAMVRAGDRFAVVNLVDVRLSGGRTVQDRDRVAVLEVVSVKDGLAKAKVVEGDIDLVAESSVLEPMRRSE